MYAIVDIETTGGSPENSKITEIAILLHDGKQVVRRFSSLVNPKCPIPYFITQATGINDEMVRGAPPFHEIAKEVLELTEGTVFVAHNVRFDYGFIKAAFKDLGYIYHRKTLCTVRLSRNTFKGLASYSLGNLCDSLNIQIKNRHRALGDAEATAILFGKIIENNTTTLTPDWLPSEIRSSNLPPLLDESVLEKVPSRVTGVYYFHNKKGDVIYVGKSKDIKKRILQHFSAAGSRKVLHLQHEIADISFEITGSELIALLLESDEIKRLKPIYNVAQKRTRAVPFFGIYQASDTEGYVNLHIEKLKEGVEPLMTADSIFSAKNVFYKLIAEYKLCLSKCGLHNLGGPCFDYQLHKCLGACLEKESPAEYNSRVMAAIESVSFKNESFFVLDSGREKSEKSFVRIENGQYKGFGFIDISFGEPKPENMQHNLKKYSHNKDIQQILCEFMKQERVKIPDKDQSVNNSTQPLNY